MKVTVMVPAANVLDTIEFIRQKELEDLARLEAERDKMKKSIIEDPNRDLKVQIVDASIKELKRELEALDRQKIYLQSTEHLVTVEFSQ